VARVGSAQPPSVAIRTGGIMGNAQVRRNIERRYRARFAAVADRDRLRVERVRQASATVRPGPSMSRSSGPSAT
jgi:hypothetical protein